MVPDWNVHIVCWGDREECLRAIASVPDDISVYVCDGRYASFPGESILTPELGSAVADIPNAEYHAPTARRLPFGHDLDAPDEQRPCVHAKARWVIEDVLPQDEWTIKLDADEVLTTVDAAQLAELEPHWKAAGDVDIKGDRLAHPTRVFQPGAWTPWIDDGLLPRDVVPRSANLPSRYDAWSNAQYRYVYYWQREPVVEIDNYGLHRPPDYQCRRLDQLETIGRSDRAEEVREQSPRRLD